MLAKSLSPRYDQAPNLQAIIETAKERGQKVRRALLASAQANAQDNKDGAVNIYYTPQSVIDYMIDTIAEPAAGSGAFLITIAGDDGAIGGG